MSQEGIQVVQSQIGRDIERVQKRCLKLLSPALSYAESLIKTGLERLDNRRDMITQSMFREIKNTNHYLLPPVKVSHSQMVLRPTYPYQLPLSKTTRYGRDFVPYCISKLSVCLSVCLSKFKHNVIVLTILRTVFTSLYMLTS